MHKVIKMYRRDGLLPVVDQIANRVRSKLMQKRYGYAEGFLIGSNTTWLTGAYARIGKNFRAGKRCRIETISEHNGTVYSPQLIIGDNVNINDDVHIGCTNSIIIGDNVLMASKIYISDHNHGSYSGENQSQATESPSARPLSYEEVIIQDDVWIGEMVSVLPGVTIGRGSIIGSNSVVSRDIPAYCIAVGSPAKPIKFYDSDQQAWVPVKK